MFRSAVRSFYYFTCGVVGVFPVAIVVMDVFGKPSTVTGNSMRVGVAPRKAKMGGPCSLKVLLCAHCKQQGVTGLKLEIQSQKPCPSIDITFAILFI